MNVWHRELVEAPPPEMFLIGYFDYEPPGYGEEETEEYEHGLPEFEE